MGKTRRKPPDVEEQMRQAIHGCGIGLNKLAEATGVHKAQLSRFLRAEQCLTLKAAARLCRYLGLRLTGPTLGKLPDDVWLLLLDLQAPDCFCGNPCRIRAHFLAENGPTQGYGNSRTQGTTTLSRGGPGKRSCGSGDNFARLMAAGSAGVYHAIGNLAQYPLP
jgi:hypothetical protein